MARKYTIRSKEEKLAIVKSVLSGTAACEYEKKGIVDHHKEVCALYGLLHFPYVRHEHE